MDLNNQIEFGMIGVKSAKEHKITTQEQERAYRDSRNVETDLQSKICKWLKKEYPGILFISDFAAGMQLSPFLSNIRSIQACDYKWPDLCIFVPSPNYHGLVIEIKTGVDKVFLKDGITLLKNDHVLSQYKTIKKLRSLGYAACFGCGEADIKKIVTDYMKKLYVNVEYVERFA